MTQNYSQEELNQAYFIQLVYTFQAAAMQQMGKLMNPLTGKVEKNMEQAKHSIDMLAMLESRTKDNLSDKEKKLLEQVLFELRMNYVDEMKVTGDEESERQGDAGEQTEEKEQQQGDAGEAGDEAAGETAGEAAGETAGEAAGEAAGETASGTGGGEKPGEKAEKTESTSAPAQGQPEKEKKKKK